MSPGRQRCQPGVELRAPLVEKDLRAGDQLARLLRDGGRDSRMRVAGQGDALATCDVKVAAASVVPYCSPGAARQRQWPLEVCAGTVRFLALAHVNSIGLLAHERKTVPAPASACCTGSCARPSLMMTRATPPSSASPAASTLRFMRPCAQSSACSRCCADTSATKLSGRGKSRYRPRTLLRMTSSAAPNAAAPRRRRRGRRRCLASRQGCWPLAAALAAGLHSNVPADMSRQRL